MHRHSILLMLLASAIVFGYTYSLNMIQALQVPFRQQPFKFSTLQFNLMYFFTFVPIFFFNIPIGIIIDRNEVTYSMFTLLIVSMLAQLVGTLMVQFRPGGYIIVMYIMRSFFGVAGQGIFTVQSIIVTKYCKKQDFQIILSMCLSIPFIFDSFNSLVTTQIYDATQSMNNPWYASVGVCLLSMFAGMWVYKLYIRPKKILEIKDSLIEIENQDKVEGKIYKQEVDDLEEQEEIEHAFDLRQLKSFSLVFWVLMLACFMAEVSLGSFMDNLNDLFVKRFNIPYTHAGFFLMIPFFGVTFFSIGLSILLSKKPHVRRSLFILSSCLYSCGQISLYFLPELQTPGFLQYIVPIFFCLTLSFGYSVTFSGLQASIPYVVNKKTIGTAYGVLGCVIGFSQSITPFANIAIIDSDPDLAISYKALNLAYAIFAVLTVCLALFMKKKYFDGLDTTYQQVEDVNSFTHYNETQN